MDQNEYESKMAIVIQKVGIFIRGWKGLYSGMQKDEFHRETFHDINKVTRDYGLKSKELISSTEPDRA